MKKIHLLISGHVQGVCFRYSTRKTAHQLGLKGFVRNLSNGQVEVIAEGHEKLLEELIEFCRRGPIGAVVEDVEVRYEEPGQEFTTFSIE